MRTYDVYHVREHNATVSVQDDGQKVWTFGEWKDFWVDADTQKAIEWVIDNDPNTDLQEGSCDTTQTAPQRTGKARIARSYSSATSAKANVR
jgi:hypothetical protein